MSVSYTHLSHQQVVTDSSAEKGIALRDIYEVLAGLRRDGMTGFKWMFGGKSSKEFIENKARLFENELSHNVSKSRRSRSEGNYGYAEKNIQHI